VYKRRLRGVEGVRVKVSGEAEGVQVEAEGGGGFTGGG